MNMKKMLNREYMWFSKSNQYCYIFDYVAAFILIIQFLFNPFNVLTTIGAEVVTILLSIFMAALGMFHYIDDRLSKLENTTGLKIWK